MKKQPICRCLYKRFIFLLISLPLFVQLSGCGALAVFSKHRKELPARELERYIHEYPSKEKLLNGALGIPSEITCLPENKEIWRYNGEIVWSGAMFLVVLAPIPLILPTGRSYKEFYIESNTVKNTIQKSAYQCGFGGAFGPKLFMFFPVGGFATETYNSCHFSQNHQTGLTYFTVTSRMPGLTKSLAENYCEQKGIKP